MAQNPPELYSIKRHGTTIETCDREPVQTPGCVQPHGVLLVLRVEDLTIAQASENAAEFLGVAAEALLNRPLAEAVGQELAGRVRRTIDGHSTERHPTFVAHLPVDDEAGRPRALDAILHTIGDAALLELEIASRSDDVADHYATVKRAIGRLRSAATLREFSDAAAQETRALTGLDRVMIYRFHPDDSGEVIAEARRDDLPSWVGLRYPEHDIPRPAREIFKRIWIRPLPDARGGLAEMVPLAHPDSGRPLEMTHCALRGASVMYTEYLHNMGVAASLTMSIMQGARLWGLIACHHHTPTVFPHRLRAACEFLAQFVSLHLAGVEEREHLSYLMRVDAVHHGAIARAAADGRLQSLTEGTPSMLEGIEADGFALLHEGVWTTAGQTPPPDALAAATPWIRSRLATTDVLATDALGEAGSGDAELGGGLGAGGLMATAPSRGSSSLLCWFRREQMQTVNWAGNPHDMPAVLGPNGRRLTPRASFELFVESVRGRSRPWLDVEVSAARRMRSLVGELFIVRAERLAALNSELARSNEELDAFAYVASHDLKEPLRGINRYASKVLESSRRGEPSGEADREKLGSILRLTARMDGLINSLLHYSRLGRMDMDRSPQDVESILEEAMDVARARLVERNAEVVRLRRMPAGVPCDAVRLREIFVNLVTNAVKYNDAATPRVEVGHVAPGEPFPATLSHVAAPAAAAGQTVFYVSDNGIGIDPQHHARIFELFKRLHGRDDFGGGSGAGLTIVRRLVEQHGGVLWLDSRPGAGSTFCFTIAPGGTPDATMRR